MEKNEITVETLLATLEGEKPLAKCPSYTYTRALQENYEKIRLMQEKRFNYTQIWKALKKMKILPENSCVHSFRQAFNRERRRRENEKELETFLKGKTKMDAGFQESQEMEQKSPKLPDKTANPDAAALEKERLLRKIGGRKVETPTGMITKYTDGSFKFN